MGINVNNETVLTFTFKVVPGICILTKYDDIFGVAAGGRSDRRIVSAGQCRRIPMSGQTPPYLFGARLDLDPADVVDSLPAAIHRLHTFHV